MPPPLGTELLHNFASRNIKIYVSVKKASETPRHAPSLNYKCATVSINQSIDQSRLK